MSDLADNLKAVQAAVRQLVNDPLAVARARSLMPLSAHAASIAASNREDRDQKEFVEFLLKLPRSERLSMVALEASHDAALLLAERILSGQPVVAGAFEIALAELLRARWSALEGAEFEAANRP